MMEERFGIGWWQFELVGKRFVDENGGYDIAPPTAGADRSHRRAVPNCLGRAVAGQQISRMRCV